MDFGFAADIYSPECEIDILTSPEIITSLLSACKFIQYYKNKWRYII